MQTLLNYKRFRDRRPFDRRFFVLRPFCASMLPGVEYCRRALCARSGVPRCCQAWSIAAVPFAPVWCASMLPGVEYCRRALCARSGVPQCCQVWSVAAGAPFAPFWCLNAARCGVLQPVHLCAVPGAPFAPNLLGYTHYSKSRKIEFWQWCPLLAARYGLYRASQILGNCKQM